jgi:hypothetical protein
MGVKRDFGFTTFGLRAERRLAHAGAPCSGYYSLVEYSSKDSTKQINTPDMFDLIKRALGSHPEFGSEFHVRVEVTVTKRAKPSTKQCHNPWAAHRCPPPPKRKRRRKS